MASRCRGRRGLPPAFRREFGGEIAPVFWQSAAERRSRGGLVLAAAACMPWLLAELCGALAVALRLRINPLKQGANMETLPAPDPAEKMPRWVIPAMLVFFLFPSLPHVFNSLFPGGKIINEKPLAENLAGSLVYEWVLHSLQWLGIGLANLLFLAFIASAQGRRGPGARFWQDLSLLSFSLYGGILIIY